jgi:hypothetical protein
VSLIARVRSGGPLAEISLLVSTVALAWKAGRRPVVAALSTWIVAATAVAEHERSIRPLVDRFGSENAGLPFSTAIVRLPLSLALPTPNLPVWGALLQVFVFVALGELLFGWRTTVAVGLTAHAAATMSARAMIALGTGSFSMPIRYLAVRDTGPSAAVVGIVVYVLARSRMPWSLGLVVGVLALELALLPNLAGREHLTAVVASMIFVTVQFGATGGRIVLSPRPSSARRLPTARRRPAEWL